MESEGLLLCAQRAATCP